MESQKTLLIDNIVIPEISNIIKENTFYDITTIEYAKYLANKNVLLLTQINNATSRKNGFCGQEDMDSMSEYWCFKVNNSCQLQAINCELCGNYIQVSNYYFKPSKNSNKTFEIIDGKILPIICNDAPKGRLNTNFQRYNLNELCRCNCANNQN